LITVKMTMNTKKRAIVFLANGFEEVEAVSIIDVLRRAGVQTTIARVDDGEDNGVMGAHEIFVGGDCQADEVQPEELDAVVLPGGMPGATNLAAARGVLDCVREVHRRKKLVCAICAAPIALAAAGVISGRKVTCYPGFDDRLSGAIYTGARVEHDSNIITGKGPGAALEFALAIVKELVGADVAQKLSQGMILSP
jgi:protein deglycase